MEFGSELPVLFGKRPLSAKLAEQVDSLLGWPDQANGEAQAHKASHN